MFSSGPPPGSCGFEILFTAVLQLSFVSLANRTTAGPIQILVVVALVTIALARVILCVDVLISATKPIYLCFILKGILKPIFPFLLLTSSFRFAFLIVAMERSELILSVQGLSSCPSLKGFKCKAGNPLKNT